MLSTAEITRNNLFAVHIRLTTEFNRKFSFLKSKSLTVFIIQLQHTIFPFLDPIVCDFVFHWNCFSFHHSFAQRFPVEFFIFLMSEQWSEGRPEIGVYNWKALNVTSFQSNFIIDIPVNDWEIKQSISLCCLFSPR